MTIQENELHYYINLLRMDDSEQRVTEESKGCVRALHNIIRTMHYSRHDKICGEDFSRLDFGNIPFNGIHFSLNGKYPCNFSGCILNEWNFNSGHSASINSIAWSPDAKYMITGSNDNTIIVWDLKLGLMLNKLTGHSGSITALAWSQNGNYILSGSDNGEIILWWLKEGKSKLMIDHKERVRFVAFTKDNNYFVSCSRNDSIPSILFDIKNEYSQIIPELTGCDPCWINKYDDLLFNCRFAKLIQHQNRYELMFINPYEDAMYLNNLGIYITAKSEDSMLFPFDEDIFSRKYYATIWDTTFDKIPIKLEEHKSMIRWVRISPDNNYCATGSIDSEIKIQSTENGKI